ncbi:hypothetical protein ASA1KI_09740 [Opitutales bacterium ASA1]|jgi:flagellar protein FliO/FliZ|uniref:flagellar biosynthetic protein FliO n=1 Tax=Congregicoccus parvus TaxID=3081749 RepID=UPI002B2E28A1|nr:hypothetical protein ASA1KI_09740 [Opitutales bacterium ASA1]
MNRARHAALLLLLAVAVACGRAAERTGPAPDEVIQPRSAARVEDDAQDAKVLAPAPMPQGLAQAAGYVVVLGMLVAGVWLLMRRGSLRGPFTKNTGKLNVLETRMLGNRQFLLVVEYEDAKMLVGVCPGRIDYLTPLGGNMLAGAIPPDEAMNTATFASTREGER